MKHLIHRTQKRNFRTFSGIPARIRAYSAILSARIGAYSAILLPESVRAQRHISSNPHRKIRFSQRIVPATKNTDRRKVYSHSLPDLPICENEMSLSCFDITDSIISEARKQAPDHSALTTSSQKTADSRNCRYAKASKPLLPPLFPLSFSSPVISFHVFICRLTAHRSHFSFFRVFLNQSAGFSEIDLERTHQKAPS